MDSAIQWISIWETNWAIHWIEIYPVDNVIHLFNNRGLVVQWLERPIWYAEGREFDSRPGHEKFRCPGQAYGFSFFQVKLFTGSVSVLLTDNIEN